MIIQAPYTYPRSADAFLKGAFSTNSCAYCDDTRGSPAIFGAILAKNVLV